MSESQKKTETSHEWELPNHQRGLVDDIVEEGQYEAAIEMLLQLRAPQYKPPVSHIRQLIFLALHPVKNELAPTEGRAVPETPRKSRVRKVPSSISSKAIVSAMNLLHSLVATNSPESIGRALPTYTSPEFISKDMDQQLDSLLAKQSACLTSARNCWEMLKEGFVFRNEVVVSPKGKSKLRRDNSIEEVLLSGSPSDPSSLVADEAWPVLEWLVSLFERDEECREEKDKIRYSQLFLEQLPPPRGGSITRWDFSIVMSIILHCLDQSDMRRQKIGFRLLHLLINLTNTIYVEQPTLVNSVCRSLLAVWTDPERFKNFLSCIESTSSAERFKITFCQKLLVDIAAAPTSLQPTAKRPRPQARAAPKARTATVAASEAPKEPVVETSQSVASKFTLPSCTEILQCVTFDLPKFQSPPVNHSLILFSRFQLVKSYASMQDERTAESRLEWDRLIQEGVVADALKRGFPGDDGEESLLYLQMLQLHLRIVD